MAITNCIKKSLVPKQVIFSATDHKMEKNTTLILSAIGSQTCLTNESASLSNHYDTQTCMTLKDKALHLSNCFQHAAELIEQLKDRKELFLLLQQDRGYDYNLVTPQSIITMIMIAIELKLEHIISIKNAGRCSACNPIERAISSVSFCCQGLALSCEESTAEVEEGVCKAKSAKEFANKNINNKKVIDDCKESTQSSIDLRKTAMSQGENAEKKIKIGTITEKSALDELMRKVQNTLKFLPSDVMCFNS